MARDASPRKKPPDGRLTPYAVKKAITTKGRWPLDEQAAAYILILPEALGWWQRAVYKGHTLKPVDDGWLLVLKATIKGKPQVAFFTADTPAETLKLAGQAIVYDQVRWKPDRFKPKA